MALLLTADDDSASVITAAVGFNRPDNIIRRLIITIAIGLGFVVGAFGQTNTTGSLFNANANQPLGSLFIDFKARNVGDILTIRVVETTESSITATSNTAKKSNQEFGLPNFGGLGAKFLEGALPGADGSKIASGSGNANFDGKGAVTRNSDFSTTLSARVKEVLPNGDLIIEATKEVNINREKQTMTLTGIARGRDISQNNIIASGNIADLRLFLSGKGIVADANKPGWLFRFFQKIFPF